MRVKNSYKRTSRIVKLMINETKQPYFVGLPAQLAFYLFLAVFPTILLVVSLLGVFEITPEQLNEWINIENLGIDMQVIETLLNNGVSRLSSVLLGLSAIWAGSRAAYALSKITNKIRTEGASKGRNYIKDTIASLAIILIFIIDIVLILVGLIYAPIYVNLLLHMGKVASILNTLWLKIRWIIVVAIVFISMIYTYVITPRTHPTPNEVLPGAGLATFGILLMSYIYKLYVTYSVTKNIIYGSLTSIVFVLMWVYFISWVICLGAVLNKAVANSKPQFETLAAAMMEGTADAEIEAAANGGVDETGAVKQADDATIAIPPM